MTRNHKRILFSGAISVIAAGLLCSFFAVVIVKKLECPWLQSIIQPATDSGFNDASEWINEFSKAAILTNLISSGLALLFCIGGLSFNFTHWPRTAIHRIVWLILAVLSMVIAGIITWQLPDLQTDNFWVWAFQIIPNSAILYWIITLLGAPPSLMYVAPLAPLTSKIRFWEPILSER